MIAIEKRWAEAVLSGFTAGGAGDPRLPLEGVDYPGAIASLVDHGNAISAVGVRLALCAIATAPAWHWGQPRTMVELAPEERAALLTELLEHHTFAVRELAILMKIQAAMALFGSPAVRLASTYGRTAGRRAVHLRTVGGA
ncbi:MAG: hypothetical protein R3B40_00675 [Polyangiales bacterium]|nr:hypothetical protein [Myxococcales bacterium]MCB9659042.1 hypothetical protein [Sandaracinaceae bacterium]